MLSMVAAFGGLDWALLGVIILLLLSLSHQCLGSSLAVDVVVIVDLVIEPKRSRPSRVGRF
jgi:hypothetical protein